MKGAVMDEIDLLRLFRDDIPGPTTDAWARARTAIAAARSVGEPPGRRMRGRRPGRRRQVMLAAAAAVIVAAGGIWYGLAAGLGGAGRPAGAVNALTAVNGCPGVAAASGVLERVTGASLVLKTPGGALVTVTTTAAATVSRQVTGTVSGLRDGTHVIVSGTGSGAGIAAAGIVIGPRTGLHEPPPTRHRQGHAAHHGPRRSPAAGGRADGTVTGISRGGFTLSTPGGFRIRVTTSGSTTVYTQAKSTVGQLKAGEFTIAVGTAQAGGTLAAATIEQGNLMPRFEHGGGIIAQPWLGCSPSAVATAAFLAAG
jgi:hypothetical protein